MTTQTLPEIATRVAEAAAQAADSTEETLLPRQSVEDAHTVSRIARATIAEFKTNMEGKLLSGMEAKQLITVYGPVATAFDQCLAKLRPFLERHPDRSAESELGSILDNFAVVERDLSEIRDRLAKYLAAAKKPIPLLDPESLRRGRADAADGRVESSLSILERLQAGEDF